MHRLEGDSYLSSDAWIVGQRPLLLPLNLCLLLFWVQLQRPGLGECVLVSMFSMFGMRAIPYPFLLMPLCDILRWPRNGIQLS